MTDDFCLSITSKTKDLKIIYKIEISKVAGIGRLSERFLRDEALVLSRRTSEICNLSIRLGVFPDACQVAKLKPIYRKGTKTEPSKYWPVSLLLIISKVIERIFHGQTKTFSSENNILYNSQSGFRPNHSTNPCLSHSDKTLIGSDEGNCWHTYWSSKNI